MKIKRSLLRYHGGKWLLAPWIISHFPDHRIYIEPYGGGASVLLRKSPCYAEIYNDLDDRIVNVFRVLRDPELSEELIHQLYLTPFARSEFDMSYDYTNDRVENARRTIVRSFMGYSSDAATSIYKTGFRCSNFQSGRFASKDWANYPNHLKYFIDRLKNVTIENRPAIDIIRRYDSEEVLFYLDPTYVHATRTHKKKTGYLFEMTEQDHIDLAKVLKKSKAMKIISGYQSSLYDDLYGDWKKVSRKSHGQAGNGKGNKINIEVLWISPNAFKNHSLNFMENF